MGLFGCRFKLYWGYCNCFAVASLSLHQFYYLLCDTLTSSATFHTPEVTKQSWKFRCPEQKRL